MRDRRKNTLRLGAGDADTSSMERPARCPDCGSDEIVDAERRTSLHGEIRGIICRVCDWSPDPRIGRPAADRSKNVGLRRRLGLVGDHADEDDPEQGTPADVVRAHLG